MKNKKRASSNKKKNAQSFENNVQKKQNDTDIVKDSNEITKELTKTIQKAKKEKTIKNPIIKKSFLKDNNELSKLIKIILIVTLIMVVIYGLTMFVTKKANNSLNEDDSSENNEKTSIQYTNIIIGTMLNKEGAYYVLIKEADDSRVIEYDDLVKTIEASDDAPKIYIANLTDSFNKEYLGKEENYYADDIADFKVTGTTLLRIDNGKVVSVYDNYDSIKSKLKELS